MTSNVHLPLPVLTMKVTLLWTIRQSSLHKKLSFNITREVCSYLGDQKRLLVVESDEVKCFSIRDAQWYQLYPLNQCVFVNHNSAVTFLEGNQVFACGGGCRVSGPCTVYLGNTAYKFSGNGTVYQQPHMSFSRFAHGLIYDSGTDSIYVFGGRDKKDRTMRSGELYQLALLQWQTLPDMCSARASFNPCLQGDLVYLCGGFDPSIETYDLKANKYTILRTFLVPEEQHCTAVVEGNDLVVLTWTCISKWNLRDGELIYQQPHQGRNPWSSCTPIVDNGVIYIVNLFAGHGINLRSGELEMEVKSANVPTK